MQVSTRTTVSLDGTEIRDIIATHLRANGTMPKGQKFTLRALLPGEPGSHDNIEVKDTDDLRLRIEWPADVQSTVVSKIG